MQESEEEADVPVVHNDDLDVEAGQDRSPPPLLDKEFTSARDFFRRLRARTPPVASLLWKCLRVVATLSSLVSLGLTIAYAASRLPWRHLCYAPDEDAHRKNCGWFMAYNTEIHWRNGDGTCDFRDFLNPINLILSLLALFISRMTDRDIWLVFHAWLLSLLCTIAAAIQGFSSNDCDMYPVLNIEIFVCQLVHTIIYSLLLAVSVRVRLEVLDVKGNRTQQQSKEAAPLLPLADTSRLTHRRPMEITQQHTAHE